MCSVCMYVREKLVALPCKAAFLACGNSLRHEAQPIADRRAATLYRPSRACSVGLCGHFKLLELAGPAAQLSMEPARAGDVESTHRTIVRDLLHLRCALSLPRSPAHPSPALTLA